MRRLLLTAVLAAGFAVPAAADDALNCVAEAVYYEARGEPASGKAAVAHVVLNRAEHPEFPDDPCAVVTDRCQFSYRCDGRPERMADATSRAEAFRTAERVLEGVTPDPTDGALFFHASRLSPGWFATRPRVGTIGGHVFYR